MRRRPEAIARAALLCCWSLAACNRVLETENLDSPDVATTLGSPTGLAAVTATLYQTIWTTNIGNPGAGSQPGIYEHVMNMSFESFTQQFAPSSVRNVIPRTAILNTRSDFGGAPRLRDFSGLSRNSRTAANVVISLDRLVAENRTLGSAGLNARARSFAFFANGVSLGNLALAYDSAAIVTPSVPTDVIPPLSGAADVMKAALTSLDSAMVIALEPAAAAEFPLPTNWINGQALSVANYVRVVRSYRARFRATVARTPAERAAVDWAAVNADVSGGIVADFNVTLDPATGWANSQLTTQYTNSVTSRIGHQMTPMILGMADTSGTYDAWLAQPLEDRRPILIKTPDRRLPAGETRAIQIANSTNAAPTLLYFRNRTDNFDLPTQNWGSSQYDHFRWRAIAATQNRGEFPVITKAEMDLLAAEGHLRLGEIALAAARIDIYRTRAGLPALAGVVLNMSTPVPGGRACVPRVPTSSGSSTMCGTIFEALKWEKRMETAFTGWASWYFDSRGWGDLPEGTPLEFPVPFQELDARQKPLYNLGGIGGKSAAAKGTYGL